MNLYRIKYIITFIFIILSFNIYSQTKDFQAWGTLGAEKEYANKYGFTLQEEVRMVDNARSAGTIFTDAGLFYSPFKWLKISGNYRFILKRLDDGHYADKHRFYCNAQFRYKTDFATYTFRSRFQQQFSDFNSEDYSAKENYLRNKFTFKPNNIKIKAKPYISFETYHNLNKSLWLDPSNIRAQTGAEFKIFHDQTLDTYFMYQKELRANKPETDFVLGLSYLFTL